MIDHKGRHVAPVTYHVDEHCAIEPEVVAGAVGWLSIGSLILHCHTSADADRLAEGARELGAMLRIREFPRAS